MAKLKEAEIDPSRWFLALQYIEFRESERGSSQGVIFGSDLYPRYLSLDQILIRYGQEEDRGLSEICERQLVEGDTIRRFEENERELLGYVRENRKQLLEGLIRNMEKVIRQLRE